ncbi:MAG: hypothetical protein DI577_06775 [Microbacterium sp.]|nr:MAG: hypothetical protein DI577_06775 [Microbacterium sp.]PZU35682.1 MAG: hypothetical protein DI575_06775 [Microbacterium sp.]
MTGSVIFSRQRALLRIAYWAFKPFAVFTRRITWVVGPEDIAHMTTHIAAAIPGSYSALHARNPFYGDARYDCVIQTGSRALGGRWAIWRRLYGGPIALAWLLNRARGFIYVGGGAYLESWHDEREFEFSFIRDHGRRLVCYFTGSDIRSPKLSAARAAATGKPNLGTMVVKLDPSFGEHAYDDARRLRAEVADRYADLVFNAREDQLSYLESDTEPFLYFYPDRHFVGPSGKFDSPMRLKVVHAPSSPVLKGTDVVRDVMSRITAEHPNVDYVELINMPNSEVLRELDSAHIALNEYYASMPGVFSIEAMARRCVVVTSASVDDEPDLGEEARGAWVVADVDTLYDEVMQLVTHPADLSAQADRGWTWAKTYASATASNEKLRAALARVDRPRGGR